VANPTLSAIMWGLALLVSAVAVLSFVRGLTHMWLFSVCGQSIYRA